MRRPNSAKPSGSPGATAAANSTSVEQPAEAGREPEAGGDVTASSVQADAARAHRCLVARMPVAYSSAPGRLPTNAQRDEQDRQRDGLGGRHADLAEQQLEGDLAGAKPATVIGTCMTMTIRAE